MSLFPEINQAVWLLGNLALIYAGVGVLIFVLAYYILFDPKSTTAGKLVFRFFVSLLGLLFLVIIGIFIDHPPSRPWWALGENVAPWRPPLRALVYVYISYSITSLAVLLVRRKWWPSTVKTSEIEPEVMPSPRFPTTEIPITKP